MATEISSELDQVIYDHPVHRVYLTDSLSNFSRVNGIEFGGIRSKQLYCNQLTLRAAPEIDSAELEFEFANQIPLGETEYKLTALTPDDLLNKAIRIEIDDTVGDKPIVWFGFVVDVTTEGAGIGKLLVQAMGVLSLAENWTVNTAHNINYSADGKLVTGVGRPFNTDDRDQFGPIGNRAAEKLEGDNHYLFSYEDRGRSKWTAQTAVEYLLACHAPLNSDGEPQPPWILDADTATSKPAEWYDVQMNTEGVSLKALLDSLIPRKRAMSYYVWYDPVIGKIVMKMFTFLATSLEVPSDSGADRTIPGNDSQFTVDPSTSLWFGADLKITESVEAQYDVIEARGEKATTTCTLYMDPVVDHFIADWSTDEEDDYKAAISTTDHAANTRYRTEDKVQHIYSRFRLSDSFNGRRPFGDLEYFIDPPLDDSGDPKPLYDASSNATGQPIRVRGLKLLHRLPLKDRLDYSGDNLAGIALKLQIEESVASGDGDSEYIPPFFCYIRRDDGKYILLDKLATATKDDPIASNKIGFALNCELPKNEPSVQLKVSTGRQTLFAKTDFTTPAATGVYSAEWDPIGKNGIDYFHCTATICIELERRLLVSQNIRTGIANRPKRVLFMDVDGARMDYVVPATIVGVSGGGDAVRSDSGGYVRDDRPRVRAIVKATAEWYGRVKRAVEFSYRQPRKLLDIGDLITNVSGEGLSQGINTPVTSISYSLGSGNQSGGTKITTGFAEVDFT